MCDPLLKAAAVGQALLPVFVNYTNTIAAPNLGGPFGYKCGVYFVPNSPLINPQHRSNAQYDD